MGAGARIKGRLRNAKGNQKLQQQRKLVLVTDDKKMLSSHRVPDGGALFILILYVVFTEEKMGRKKSHQNAYQLFDSSAEKKLNKTKKTAFESHLDCNVSVRSPIDSISP